MAGGCIHEKKRTLWCLRTCFDLTIFAVKYRASLYKAMVPTFCFNVIHLANSVKGTLAPRSSALRFSALKSHDFTLLHRKGRVGCELQQHTPQQLGSSTALCSKRTVCVQPILAHLKLVAVAQGVFFRNLNPYSVATHHVIASQS